MIDITGPMPPVSAYIGGPQEYLLWAAYAYLAYRGLLVIRKRYRA